MKLSLDQFDYELPKDLIAQYPLKQRDACRLLVVDRKKCSVEHRTFADIKDYLFRGDTLVLNDTEVRTCRLRGNRLTGGKVEVFLLKHKGGLCFDVMLKPGRVKRGEKIVFGSGAMSGTVTGENEVTFEASDEDRVYSFGEIPLPPYIKRPPDGDDPVYYQTVYARNRGSVAAPTAGLHFTRELLAGLEDNGVKMCRVTLHVGLGTFKSVTEDDITKHEMGQEYFEVPESSAGALAAAKRDKTRIIAVGTTSCRTLESFALGKTGGYTGLFMYPGYEFKMVDGILTNFHLPRTTLFMLVCAFAGTSLMKEAYSQAVANKYRFYSYGDAMLIV